MENYIKKSEIELLTPEDFSEKEHDILLSTLAVALRFGIQDLPIEKVCECSGATINEVYELFGSKSELVDELYIAVRRHCLLEISKRIDLDMLKSIEDNNELYEAYHETFLNVWKDSFAFYRSHPAHYQFMEQLTIFDLLNEETFFAGEEYNQSLLDYLEYGQQKGIFRSTDKMCVSYNLFSNIGGIVKLLFMFEDFPESKINAAMEMSWDGITSKWATRYQQKLAEKRGA